MLQRLAAGFSALLVGACSVVGVRSGTEEPAFERIAVLGEVEVRRYASRLAAETEVVADESASRSEGFSRLAGYIFGGNVGASRIAMTAPVSQAPQRIAMTAPVAQVPSGEGYSIRFFLPAALRTPPTPRDPLVRIVEVPAETVAVLRYTGSTGPQAVAATRARLLDALRTGPWRPLGEPMAWFYDPPWTIPALRRNEVAVPVLPRD